MSLAVLQSRALNGVSAPEVVVETHLANGLPSFALVGLPDAEVKEARDRVRAAIQTARYDFPNRRITCNLAPADLPKESGRFDLAPDRGRYRPYTMHVRAPRRKQTASCYSPPSARATARRTACWGSIAVRTTISTNRSNCPSSMRACARCCVAGKGRRLRWVRWIGLGSYARRVSPVSR